MTKTYVIPAKPKSKRFSADVFPSLNLQAKSVREYIRCLSYLLAIDNNITQLCVTPNLIWLHTQGMVTFVLL